MTDACRQAKNVTTKKEITTAFPRLQEAAAKSAWQSIAPIALLPGCVVIYNCRHAVCGGLVVAFLCVLFFFL